MTDLSLAEVAKDHRLCLPHPSRAILPRSPVHVGNETPDAPPPPHLLPRKWQYKRKQSVYNFTASRVSRPSALLSLSLSHSLTLFLSLSVSSPLLPERNKEGYCWLLARTAHCSAQRGHDSVYMVSWWRTPISA